MIHPILHPGVEPGPAASKAAVRPPHSQRPPAIMPSPGVEPGLRPSEGRVRIRHTPRAMATARAGSPLTPSALDLIRTDARSLEDVREIPEIEEGLLSP